MPRRPRQHVDEYTSSVIDAMVVRRTARRARRKLRFPNRKNLNWAEAAALPLVTLTAWHMLVTRAQVRPGEVVLVHAAGSGVGSLEFRLQTVWRAP
jgi:NADPH:quinone reductase-like Zn-dependent oxidoreductase